MSRQFVRVFFLVLGAGFGSACGSIPVRHGTEHTFLHAAMGTEFRLVLYADSEVEAASAARAAFQKVDELERVATDYDADSEARRLVERPGARTQVSMLLGELIQRSLVLTRDTGGAFDPSIGPLAREWKRALRTGEWPRQDRWDRAVRCVGLTKHLRVEQTAHRGEVQFFVTPLVEGMRLDFGGIAKGFAVDLALAELRGLGITRALMDGGGDVAALDPPPGKDGWRVEVRPFGEDPDGQVYRFLLANGAIATSGDAYQGATLSGVPLQGIQNAVSRFGHVLDPRTGLPLPSPRAALMTAPTALIADALATALMVLGEPPLNGLVTPVSEPLAYESETQEALRRGIFFPSTGGDPCVGAEFPQDGVRVQEAPSSSVAR